MADASEQAILEKFNRGEALTADETKVVMGGAAPTPADSDKLPGEEEEEGMVDLDKGKEKPAESSSSEESQSAESASSSEKKEPEESSSSEQSSSDESIASSSETSESEESSSSAESKPKDEGKDTRSLSERLEGELGKPEGTEDLSEFNDREKGLFWALRAERKKRQEAEADRDVERFKKIKDENLRKETENRAKTDEEFKTKLDELLKGDDEWINKSDVRKLVELLRTPAAKDEGTADDVDAIHRKNFIRVAAMNASDLVEQRRIKGEELPDFDITLNLAPQIIETNEEYKKQVAQAYLTGKNPAYLSYELIRKDPKFAALYKPGTAAPKVEKPAAKPDKKAEGKENLKKLNANEKKPKTTGTEGAGGGGEITDTKGNVYTLAQLMSMDDATFRKVPREVREKFLAQT